MAKSLKEVFLGESTVKITRSKLRAIIREEIESTWVAQEGLMLGSGLKYTNPKTGEERVRAAVEQFIVSKRYTEKDSRDDVHRDLRAWAPDLYEAIMGWKPKIIDDAIADLVSRMAWGRR